MENNQSLTNPAAPQTQAQGDEVMAFLAAGTKPEMLKMYGRTSVDDLPGAAPAQGQVPVASPPQTAPVPVPNPRAQVTQQPAAPLPQQQTQQASTTTAPVLNEKDLSIPSFDENPQTEEAEQDSQKPEVKALEPEVSEAEPASKEKSFADLRKALNKVNEDLKAKSQEITTYQNKIKSYEEGEVIPEKLRPKLDRAETLEKYETLHAFKVSQEYENKFVKPLEGLTQSAKRLAEDYRVDPSVIDRAMKTTDRREQDRILVNHFGDLGALEVKKVIGEMSSIQTQMAEAEKNPFQAFEAAKNEARMLRQRELEAGIKQIEVAGKNGWVNAIQKHSITGEFPELMITGDTEHDATVKPILQRASKEFSNVMKVLVAHGVKSLPPEVVEIMADRFMRSEAYGTAAQQRNEIARHNYDIQQQNAARAGFRRPGIGGVNTGGASGIPAPVAEPKMGIEDIFAMGNKLAAEKVTSNRR